MNLSERRRKVKDIGVSHQLKQKAVLPVTGMRRYDEPELDTQQGIKIIRVIKPVSRMNRIFHLFPYVCACILVGATILFILFVLLDKLK